MTEETQNPQKSEGSPSSAANPPPGGEVFAFQAEMRQLLSIIIHSLYSEREVFLRELISNASDAINKLKFTLLTNQAVRDKDAPLEITLEVDPEGKTITISDTGVGMTKDELIANLGTIAKSGTLDFVKRLAESGQESRQELIGQFGVGFYAVFMVADRVVVDSCPADPAQPAFSWTSDGGGSYSLAPSQRTRRGTSIRVELREDALEFNHGHRLETIVKKYSSFIPHPVRMEGRQLNSQEAIWASPKEEVKEEQYNEFFKFITHGFEPPAHTLHISIDAPVQYRALLFVPGHLDNEVLYSREYTGLHLYANKVFIQADNRELLPVYLRFLRGVVDSEDIPLNVSRQTAQQGAVVAKIQTSLTGRVLRELKSLAEADGPAYNKLWAEYGRVMKEGIATDLPNRDKLMELLRFGSSAAGDKELITLKDYLGRMTPDQKEIFYLTGPARAELEANPSLEYFKSKGLEVLFLYDQVDDFVMTSLGEYEGKKFASIDQADLDVLKGDEAAKKPPENTPAMDSLLAYLKEALAGHVADVVASRRLVESPAVLVNPDGVTANMEKMMRLMDTHYRPAQKVLEINPANPLVVAMAAMVQTDTKEPLLKELALQLLENCLLVEGLLEKPGAMVHRVQSLMTQAAQMRAAQMGGAKPKTASKTARAETPDTPAKTPAEKKSAKPGKKG